MRSQTAEENIHREFSSAIVCCGPLMIPPSWTFPKLYSNFANFLQSFILIKGKNTQTNILYEKRLQLATPQMTSPAHSHWPGPIWSRFRWPYAQIFDFEAATLLSFMEPVVSPWEGSIDRWIYDHTRGYILNLGLESPNFGPNIWTDSFMSDPSASGQPLGVTNFIKLALQPCKLASPICKN